MESWHGNEMNGIATGKCMVCDRGIGMQWAGLRHGNAMDGIATWNKIDEIVTWERKRLDRQIGTGWMGSRHGNHTGLNRFSAPLYVVFWVHHLQQWSSSSTMASDESVDIVGLLGRGRTVLGEKYI